MMYKDSHTDQGIGCVFLALAIIILLWGMTKFTVILI